MSKGKIIGAIEMGTSKIVVLIGEVFRGAGMNIIGMGQTSSQGIKKGEIYDFKEANNAVHAAIMSAEKNAGVTIDKVYLSQTGGHLKGMFNTATVNVTASSNIVSNSDIARVANEAKSKELPPGRLYLHHIRNGYKLDNRSMSSPLGLEGEKLTVGYWSIYGDMQKIRDHIHVINGFGLSVEDVVVSSLASGATVVSDTEKKNGALVIDIGCGTTDYALYQNGFVIKTGVISVGGDHFTNDLSLGLRIDCKLAESLKCKHGKAIIDADKKEKVWLMGNKSIGDKQFLKDSMYKILNARAKELFEVIKLDIQDIVSPQELMGGVILTGGGSLLTSIEDVGNAVLGVETRKGNAQSWVREDLRKEEYCTVLGLLHFALTGQESEPIAKKEKPRLLKKVAKIFNF